MERVITLAGHLEKRQPIKKRRDCFENLNLAPADPILGTMVAYMKDTNPNKVNLGIGAYRDEMEKPYVFEAVKKAQREIVEENMDKEYLPIDGHPGFVKAAQKLLFGEKHPLVLGEKIVTVQTIAGSGALRIGFEFLKNFMPGEVYCSDPTWGNHFAIIQDSGLPTNTYPYFNPKTKGLDFEGMCEGIANANPGSIILLHVCAHNPTGIDPTPEQWRTIAQIIKENELFPFFDCAYQGFASGDLVKDAEPIQIFIEEGLQMLVAQSLSKNMGLYGERIGALHVVCTNREVAKKTLSQINLIPRAMYSMAPSNGARIAYKILSDPKAKANWEEELKVVSGRIQSMRKHLYYELQRLKVPGNWELVINQIGMFSYTGLSVKQCEALIDKHHIYLVKNGRISMSGITTKNVKYIAQAIKDVVENVH